MIEVVPFKARHYEEIADHPSQAYIRGLVEPSHLAALEAGRSFTALVQGRPIGVGGVVERWPNCGDAWAIFDMDCKTYFFAVTNAVRRFLADCPQRRIEVAVEIDFEPGHRWIRLLGGFELEAPRLRAYLPNGHDAALYARIH